MFLEASLIPIFPACSLFGKETTSALSFEKFATLLNSTTPCGAYIFIPTLAIPSFSYCIALLFVTFNIASFATFAAVFLNVMSVFITTLIPLLISVTNSV